MTVRDDFVATAARRTRTRRQEHPPSPKWELAVASQDSTGRGVLLCRGEEEELDRIHGTLSRIGPTATVHLTAELRCVRMIIARCSSLLCLCSPDLSIHPLLCSAALFPPAFAWVDASGEHGRRKGTSPMGMLPPPPPSPGTRRIIHSDLIL